MALNKDELIKFLAEQTGKEVTDIELDDEDINKFYEEELELELEEEEEEEELDEEEEEEVDDEDEDDEDDFGSGIDISKLDETSKMIYNELLKEKERNRKKEVINMIEISGLKDQHKTVLKRMAKSGSKKKDIESSINDLLEMENSNKRKKATSVVLPKGKIASGKKKKSGPKMGTREYGALLAKSLYKNRI